MSKNKKQNIKVDNNELKDSLNQLTTLSYAVKNNAKSILKDLSEMNLADSFFKKFTKSNVIQWLDQPEKYSDKLIEVSCYLYNVSNHYKRLIQYFSSLPLLSYVIYPNFEITDKENLDDIKEEISKLNLILKNMNIRQEFHKIFTTNFREDIFYGLVCKSDNYDSFYIKKLPSKYCQITYIQDGCYGISFNFDYFKSRESRLGMYPGFHKIYTKLKNDKNKKNMWYELDIESAACFKWDDSVDYPLPPLVGVLASLFDLEDYKKLKKAKEKIGNYKLLSLVVPFKEGREEIPFDRIKEFYEMTSQQLPDNIGFTLSPAKLEEHTFEKAGTSNSDFVAEATTQFWNTAGVSELLFGSSKGGNSIINASTKIDSTYIKSLYGQIERWLNSILKREFDGVQKYKLDLLDVNILNKDEVIDRLIKLGTYGVGNSYSQIAAIFGYTLADIKTNQFLENELYDIQSGSHPFKSSHTQSDTDKEVGNQEVDDSKLSDKGQISRDRDETKE